MKSQEVFNIVASKYDLMNDVMSVGTHRYWKECMIDWLGPFIGMKIIDVAGGTGDISHRFLKRINEPSLLIPLKMPLIISLFPLLIKIVLFRNIKDFENLSDKS